VKTQREMMFAVGIALGTAAGFVLGTYLAFRIGEHGVESVRRFLERILGRDGGPKFEYLLQ
jgi:hypothetical protein